MQEIFDVRRVALLITQKWEQEREQNQVLVLRPTEGLEQEVVRRSVISVVLIHLMVVSE